MTGMKIPTVIFDLKGEKKKTLYMFICLIGIGELIMNI